jgi:RHS repeat-associated protein
MTLVAKSSRARSHPGSGVSWRCSPPRRAATVRGYVYGSYVDELLAILPASGLPADRKFVHSNHLYSVAALTDNSGNVVERYRYSAYGERTVLAADGVTTRTGSLHGNQVGFTGRYEDKETGLWYFRARYYSGSLGRFVGRDPSGYIDGMGLYVGYYAPNELDPSGRYKDKDNYEYCDNPKKCCCAVSAIPREGFDKIKKSYRQGMYRASQMENVP